MAAMHCTAHCIAQGKQPCDATDVFTRVWHAEKAVARGEHIAFMIPLTPTPSGSDDGAAR